MLLSILGLKRWGPFVEEELTFFDGLNMFVGGNESGKTWVLRGLAASLLGFDVLPDPPWNPARPKDAPGVEVVFAAGSGHFLLQRSLEGQSPVQKLMKREEEGFKALSQSGPDIERFVVRELGVKALEFAKIFLSPDEPFLSSAIFEGVVLALERAERKVGMVPAGEAASRLTQKYLSSSSSAAACLEGLKRSLAAAEEARANLSGLNEGFAAQRQILQGLGEERRRAEERVAALERKMSLAERRAAADEHLRRWGERSKELEEMTSSLEEAQKRIEEIEGRRGAFSGFSGVDIDALLARASELEKAKELLRWRAASYEEARKKLEAEKSDAVRDGGKILPLAQDRSRRQALRETLTSLRACEARMIRARKVRLVSKEYTETQSVARRMMSFRSDRKQEEDLKAVEERMLSEIDTLQKSLDLELEGIECEGKPETALAEADVLAQRLDEIQARQRELEGIGTELGQREASFSKKESELLSDAAVQSLEELRTRTETYKGLLAERASWDRVIQERIAGKGLDGWRQEAAKARRMVERLEAELREIGESSWTEKDDSLIGEARKSLEKLLERMGETDGQLKALRSKLKRGPSELDGMVQYFKGELSAFERNRQAATLAASILEGLDKEARSAATPLMERETERVLSVLTQGKHTRVVMGPDQPILRIAMEGRDPVMPSALGAGTTSCLAVGAKLAALALVSDGGQCPIVMDSPFMGMDEERARALIGVLAGLARQGRQIICTTSWPGVEQALQAMGQGAPWRCVRLGRRRRGVGGRDPAAVDSR